MIEVIAEIGINWQGNLGLAKNMIWSAKGNGADVVKFQIYDPKKVLDPEHPYLKPHWDLILKTELSRQQVNILKEECEKANIEFMASVFRPEVVGWTEEIGMKRYKIASRSIYDYPLAEAIYRTGKPVIASYGMLRPGPVPAIDSMVKFWEKRERLFRLYCVSKYPTSLCDVSLRSVDFGTEHYLFTDRGLDGTYSGLSDHTVGITASVVAMSRGAKIIEKHVTCDKTLEGPDHRWSISFNELNQLCNMRDQIEEILY